MSIESVSSGVSGIGCLFLGFLAMIVIASGAWMALPILFIVGVIMVFVVSTIASIIEWVAKLFGYDPDKKTAEQLEADRILADTRADVARRNHARLLYESELRAQTESRDPYEV